MDYLFSGNGVMQLEPYLTMRLLDEEIVQEQFTPRPHGIDGIHAAVFSFRSAGDGAGGGCKEAGCDEIATVDGHASILRKGFLVGQTVRDQ